MIRNAFTASGLGTVREGSGIVIGENGLVLTIGYLITEATQVWLTTYDKRAVPGHVARLRPGNRLRAGPVLGELKLPPLDLGTSAASGKVGHAGDLHRWPRPVCRSAMIVAKQEFAGYWEYLLDEAIFTAPAHPSWGGAAVVGADGKLLGVGSLHLQMSQGGEVADINMVVPIDLLLPILDDLLDARPGRPRRHVPGSACSPPRAMARWW